MAEEMKPSELTLHLEGLHSNAGDMLASVYANKIDDFRILFDEAQKCIVKAKECDDLLISNLTHNSPTATTFRTTGPAGLEAFDHIVETINEVNNKAYRLLTDEVEYFIKLRDFCKTNFNKLNGLWFTTNQGKRATVTSYTVAEMDDLLLPDSMSYGSIKGKILRYSGDTKDKYFHVYPTIGGRVKCMFSDDMRDTASNAVERNALITGKLKYRSGEFSPYEIDVYDIEILPQDNDLAKLGDIKLNDSQKNGDSVQIIKGIRRDW